MISVQEKYEMLDALAAAIALKLLSLEGLPLPEKINFTGDFAATAIDAVLSAVFPGRETVLDGDGWSLEVRVFFSGPTKADLAARAFEGLTGTALAQVETEGNELVLRFDEMFDDLIPTLKGLVEAGRWSGWRC